MLGTSAMVPTKTRNHSAIFLSFGSEGLLFDCGEGTQRQLKLAGIKLTKITKIFISHWDGDHILGIPGLIQSLASEDPSKTLNIYGPVGSKEKIEFLKKALNFEIQIEVKVTEITDGTIIDSAEYQVDCASLEHTKPCFGFSFIEKNRRKIKVAKIKELGIPEGPLLGKLQKGESVKFKNKTISPDDTTSVIKGKKITYIADTRKCKNAVTLAEDSDILISESTYARKEREKADTYFHMTSSEAAEIAHASNSKKLILTHISQRYKDPNDLLDEAREIFPNTDLGFDLMKIKP